MKGRRAGAGAALGAAAAVLLAGCGVPTTGVVDVGDPASGLASDPAVRSEVVAFFLDGDRLQPAGRVVADGAEPVVAAVNLLFAGPAAAGRPDLTTRLPEPRVTATVRMQGRTVAVRLPAGVPQPDKLAMRQLACTVAEASPSSPTAAGTAVPRPTTPPVRVEAVGSGWRLEQTGAACPPASLPFASATTPPS